MSLIKFARKNLKDKEAEIKTRVSNRVEETIIAKKVIFSLALFTLILIAIRIFIDVAVITVSPIALAIAKRLNFSKMAILCAMMDGRKSRNVISPNPNIIVDSENTGAPLFSVMYANIILVLIGLIIIVIIANMLIEKGEKVIEKVEEKSVENLPSFTATYLGQLLQ